MQFSAITISALLATLVSAGPVRRDTTETVTISSFDVRNIDSAIAAASFTVQPDNVNCEGTSGFDSTISCDTEGWSFYVKQGSTIDNYALTLYKTTGVASGIYNTANATLICHAGGSSATDFECDQPSIETISMTLNPDGPLGLNL